MNTTFFFSFCPTVLLVGYVLQKKDYRHKTIKHIVINSKDDKHKFLVNNNLRNKNLLTTSMTRTKKKLKICETKIKNDDSLIIRTMVFCGFVCVCGCAKCVCFLCECNFYNFMSNFL